MCEDGCLYFSDLDAFLTTDLSTRLPPFKPKSLENFTNDPDKLKTLVCHDMKGGYLEQDKLEGCVLSNGCYPYLVLHWWNIDIFCYFSHYFITVPPVAWIEQAHKHGVIVQGTFITEFDDGEKICEKLFSSKDLIDELVDKMIELCKIFNFDGWLVNIENIVKPGLLPNMEYFLETLTKKSRQVLGETSSIIWYDSVIEEGKLDWQNELNEKNKKYFDLTDGIYLNYAWKEEHLQRTLEAARGQKLRDIYVGIDVFGRGCLGQIQRVKKFFRDQLWYKQIFSAYFNPYSLVKRWTIGVSYISCGKLFSETSQKMIMQNKGGGGYNCSEPLELIKKYDLSVALFAPGWIVECHEGECVLENSFKFWSSMQDFLPHRTITAQKFSTDFSSGLRPLPDGTKHFKMTSMGLQPHYFDSTNLYLTIDGLKIISAGEHILFLCDIHLDESKTYQIKVVSSSNIGIKLVIQEDQEVLLVREENSSQEGQIFVISQNVKHIKKILVQVQKDDCPVILREFSLYSHH